jgi:hypothetical protein
MALQDKPKICVPRLVQEIQAIYDEDGKYCLDNVDVGGIILKDDYKHLTYYIIGLLNSKILTRYLSLISTPFRGGFWSCNKQYLEQLPIVLPTELNNNKSDAIGEVSSFVKKIIELKNKNDDRSQKDSIFLESELNTLIEQIYENP